MSIVVASHFHRPAFMSIVVAPRPVSIIILIISMFPPLPQQYQEMLEWHANMNIGQLLQLWLPKYPVIKEYLPHYSYGVSRLGLRVVYELYGDLQVDMLKQEGICREDIEKHIALLNLFTEKIYRRADLRVINVIDLKGFSITKGSILFFLKILRWSAETKERYYPGLVRKVLIINPPLGTGVLVKLMTAILPPSFTSKIVIIHDLIRLRDFIEPKQIPLQYGGTCPTPLDESPYEEMLRDFQRDILPKPLGLSVIVEGSMEYSRMYDSYVEGSSTETSRCEA